MALHGQRGVFLAVQQAHAFGQAGHQRAFAVGQKSYGRPFVELGLGPGQRVVGRGFVRRQAKADLAGKAG